MGWFRSDLRNVVDLLERDSADHLLARRLCALLHPRLRNKAVSRTDGSRKGFRGRLAGSCRQSGSCHKARRQKTACWAKIAAGPLKK